MNITELTKKVRESAITRTKAQQVELLNDKAKAHPLKV